MLKNTFKEYNHIGSTIVPNTHHIMLKKYGFTLFFLTLDFMCALVYWKKFIIP